MTMDTVEIKQCVITTLLRRGLGKENSPVRVVTQVWAEGLLIAEHDPSAPVYNWVSGEFEAKK